MTVAAPRARDGFYDFRKLRLVVRSNGKTVVDRLLCANLRCSPGSHHVPGAPERLGRPSRTRRC